MTDVLERKRRQDDEAEDKETTNKNNIPYRPLQGLPVVLPSDYQVCWEIECDDKNAGPALKIIKALDTSQATDSKEVRHQAMFVGGASRCYAYNTFAKNKHYPNDYDIVTNYDAESALRILHTQGFNDAVIDKYDHNLIQIPSANADVYCVNSSNFDMEADARMRVLHICAMYTQVDFSYDPPVFKIYATSSAVDDLVSLRYDSQFLKVITFTNNPKRLFTDDPFRIAKVIKWVADFGVDIPQVYWAIKRHLKLLTPAGQLKLQKMTRGRIKALSAEELEKRRFSLLLKLFAENSIAKRLFIFDAFAKYGIWRMFFPGWDEKSARERIYNINGDPRYRGASMNAFFRGIVSDALRANSASRDEIILRFNLSHWESGEQRRRVAVSASASSVNSSSRVSDTPSPDGLDTPSPNTVIVVNSASSSLQSTSPQSLSSSQPVSPLSTSTPSLASPPPIPFAQPVTHDNVIVVPISPESSLSLSQPVLSLSASTQVLQPSLPPPPPASLSQSETVLSESAGRDSVMATPLPRSSSSESINTTVIPTSPEVHISASLSPPRVLATEVKAENSANTTSIPQVPTPRPPTKKDRRLRAEEEKRQQLQAQRDAFAKEEAEKQRKRQQEIKEKQEREEAAEEAQRSRERENAARLEAERAEQRRIEEQKEKERVENERKARLKELEAKMVADAKEKAQNLHKLRKDLETLQASSTSVSLTVFPRSGGGSQVVNLGGGSTSCASTSPVAQAARKKYPLWLLLTMGLFFLVSTKEFLSRTNKYFAFDPNDRPNLFETISWGFVAIVALWPFYFDNGTEEEKSNEPKRKF